MIEDMGASVPDRAVVNEADKSSPPLRASVHCRDELERAVRRALEEAVADDENPEARTIIHNRSDDLARAIIPIVLEACAEIAEGFGIDWSREPGWIPQDIAHCIRQLGAKP